MRRAAPWPIHRRSTRPLRRTSAKRRSEEHTSELQSHRDLHSFPTRRSSDLFRRFPDYQMKVYATRRTVAYPPAIDAATQANVGKAYTLAADSIAGARLGFPFPEPRSGVEILWNHRLRYRGDTVQSQSTQAVVGEQGVLETYKQTEKVYFRYGNIADPVDLSKQNILLYYLTWFGKGAHDIDFVALVHETANQLEDARGVWVIPPHIPRLFRIPPVGYDQ